MREALLRITSSYTEFTSNSKILLLFVISVLVVVLLDENISDCDRGRRINPAVFLLSLWSGISYAFVRVIPRKNKILYLISLLILFVITSLSGQFVISEEAFENSVYSASSGGVTVILSAILIVACFIIYFMIARNLFSDKTDRITFMIVSLMLHLFDFYSVNTATLSIFLSPIRIGSIVVHIILPLLLWLYLENEDKIIQALMSEEEATEDGDNEEIPEEWDMKKHKILNIRNMAIAFAALIVIFAAVVFVLNNKINSLYDATVMLEKAANTKMSVYEVTKDDGSIVMTLMISPEGTVIAVDGGGRENGDACYELISEYTDNVDKWYVYGDDEENKGAYRHCKEKGITVDEVYLISGIERLK
ncbi:MAG: DUF6077 domain-containing protein [Lachnospiraceae bacterium]|nr:DUF6077 domain-containing protein [Lachnospiraceae bacterium]